MSVGGLEFGLLVVLGILAVLAALSLLYLTVQVHEPATYRRVIGVAAFHAACYLLLRVTGWLQPPVGRLSHGEAAEYRSRLVGTFNAIILIVGSLLCFSEWPYAGTDGFISEHGAWGHPVTFAALFVGYLQWDVCWIIGHLYCYDDIAALVHHAIFIGITHYVLWGWYFKQVTSPPPCLRHP